MYAGRAEELFGTDLAKLPTESVEPGQEHGGRRRPVALAIGRLWRRGQLTQRAIPLD